MPFSYDHRLIEYARQLRREATRQEKRLWYDFLSKYPVRFQRQKAIGTYIVDFYCHAVRLVIEIDGDQHGEPDAVSYDSQRTAFFEQQGLKVIRFTNQEVDTSLDAVCAQINRVVLDRLPPDQAEAMSLPRTEYD